MSSVDLRELRSAVAAEDADRVLAALDGRQVDDVLQQVGLALMIALERRRENTEPVVVSVINRLTLRAGEGDDVLAEDLLARLRAAPLKGRVVPVDLEILAAALEPDPGISTGGYLDLHTGWVYDRDSADPMTAGDDAAIDFDEEPDR
ncbi:hypothetical protein AU196_24840 [Mycobacterium sp. IS-1742]|uniref:hypothetical protein n=1 Tax=Mycobacterium sp. IS-1742 TaxID=1772285 RepID=UPI00074031FF|nr:hypothetical protein [Mycobacterium sp. IS-1742]KUI30409.1 hypothetical protein AU196_24840 [Mycobacterium sp. IS-1742]